MAGSNSTQKKKLTAPVGGMTARDAMTERQQHAADCTMWAQQLQQAVQDGIDSGVADSLLESGVKRILELEQLAVEQQAAAKAVAEAHAALRATPISIPVTRVGSTAAKGGRRRRAVHWAGLPGAAQGSGGGARAQRWLL